MWKCYAGSVRPTSSLKTGTIFEASPIALEKWLPGVWMLLNCKNGISSYEVHRDIGVTQKTAWFMLHRIRLAAHDGGFTLSGEVELDGTLIGGGGRGRYKARSVRGSPRGGGRRGGEGGWGVERGRGRVRLA